MPRSTSHVSRDRHSPIGSRISRKPDDPHIEIKDLILSYDSDNAEAEPVIAGLNLRIPAGQFCAIIGPSGCGKSTLLRLIDGLQKPTSGRVMIDGAHVENPPASIGMVFQHFALMPWKTVRKNVEFALGNLGVPKTDSRVRAEQWLSRVGLTDYLNHYPGQISGGMQQRVGLARALAIEPDLMLMDEPFGSLDAQTRILLQEEVLRLWEHSERTVVFVTHDIEEALYLADRVIVMSARPGRIIEDMPVPFARPRDETVKAHPDFVTMKIKVWELLRGTRA